MKRVIVLSWFKKVTSRLFGAEKDELNDTPKMNEEEIKQTEDSSHEKPAFRFPIITDAEIYGWDENEYEPKNDYEELDTPINDDDLYTNPSNFNNDDDEYETIPLFKNERWPGRNDEPIVHRSNPVLQNTRVHEVVETSIEPEKPKLNTEKHFKSRFVPSTVPSPIHGFSNPQENESEKEALIEQDKGLLSNTLVDDEQTKKPNEKDIPEEVRPVEQKTSKDSILEQVSVEENTSSFVVKDLEVVEQPLEIEAEELLVEDVLEEADVLIEPPLEIIKKVDSSASDFEASQDILTEAKKEKTIPFNVIMLKSDKEKLAKVKHSISGNEQMTLVELENTNALLEQVEEKQDSEAILVDDSIEIDYHTEDEPYVFPPIDILLKPESQLEDKDWLQSQSEKLEESLSHFGVQATVVEALQGPTVTRFELTVGQGTKVSRVRNLTDDLKLSLAAKEIRIQAPIPGKSSIGIEIPNRQTRPVRISEVIETDNFKLSSSPLEAVLGLGLTGKPVTIDLRKMPHGLIAGATGSGKSVCINSILVSLLYKAHPSDLKMMLIDPKMVELAPFNGIPHLISPVITDVKAATAALKWAVKEMDRRYELLAHAGVRDIERYNKVVAENKQLSLKMPYLLIVIDELADLMMMAPADVEISISRIAQKARACGIHLIIATQRPSVDVITGTIKANIPTRIAFSVSSQIDSRTIIDGAGAERLLGKGDMLYIGNGQSAPTRLQGTFVTDEEIEAIIEHVQSQASPQYLFGQDDLLKTAAEEETDPLFEQACLFIYEQGSASTSLLQRNFSIGYNRAAKIMDRLEVRGYISEQRGSKARDVLMTENDLKQYSEVNV